MSIQTQPQSQTTFSSGIYNRFGSENRDEYGFASWVPGLPHLIAGKQTTKGWLLLLGSIAAFISALILLAPNFHQLVYGVLEFARNKNAQDIANIFNFPGSFRATGCLLLLTFILYLTSENKRDLAKNFRNIEADRKPTLFAASMSGSYLSTTSLLATLLIYGLLFHFVPIQKDRSIEIEMTPFVDNPIQKTEPKQPPKNAKHKAVQNAVNSGRHDKRLPVSPGISQPKPKPQMAQPAKPSPSSQPKQSLAEKLFKPSKPVPPSPYSPPKPVAAPQPKGSSAPKPLLPTFKPKVGEDRAVLSSNEPSHFPAPAQPVNPGSSASSSSQAAASASSYSGSAGRGPVLPSRTGGFSSGAGLGNAGPNNNPNGPVTVAARKDIDYGPFMQDLQRRIQQSWKPASIDKADQVTLMFSLHKDGSLIVSSLSTVKSSSPEAEAAARQAVIAASPGFRPLPEGSPDPVRIEFTFTRTGTRFMGLKKY